MNEEEKTNQSTNDNSQPKENNSVNNESSTMNEKPQIINDQLQNEDMDVHYPNHVTHKKKRGEYFDKREINKV